MEENRKGVDVERVLDFAVRAFYGSKPTNMELTYNNIKTAIENDKKKGNIGEEELIKRVRVLDKVYKMFSDERFRKDIIDYKITQEQFISKYGEQILGDNKRTYNMSTLRDDGRIGTYKDGDKKIKYNEVDGKEIEFLDMEGKKVIIQRVGELRFDETYVEGREVSKYKVVRQIDDNKYYIDYVFSNIILPEMQVNEEYKRVVLEELLSQSNIKFSKAGGYVGSISKMTEKYRSHDIGEEWKDSEYYVYRASKNYALVGNVEDATAVMLYQEAEAKANRENIGGEKHENKNTASNVKEDEFGDR